MNVILKCPVCKSRQEVTFEEYCKSILPLSNKRIRCQEENCGIVMVYHKDVPR
jgi:hypothetical protein